MNVLIATEYGDRKGRGHLTRCLGIAQGFQEKNIPVKLLLDGKEPLDELGVEFERLSWIENSAPLFSADCVILDSYRAPHSLYLEVSEQVKKAAYIDDYNRLPYPKGVLINGNVQGPSLPFTDEQKQHALLGLKYIPLRKAFWDCEQNPIRDEVKKIFVVMGGTDPLKLRPKVEGWIEKHFSHLECIRSKDMLRSMLEADLVISAGGQTLYELARVGVPTVAVGVAQNQEENITGLEKAGTLLFGGWHNDPALEENVVRCVQELLPHSSRQKLTKNLIDGQGVRRIVEALT